MCSSSTWSIVASALSRVKCSCVVAEFNNMLEWAKVCSLFFLLFRFASFFWDIYYLCIHDVFSFPPSSCCSVHLSHVQSLNSSMLGWLWIFDRFSHQRRWRRRRRRERSKLQNWWISIFLNKSIHFSTVVFCSVFRCFTLHFSFSPLSETLYGLNWSFSMLKFPSLSCKTLHGFSCQLVFNLSYQFFMFYLFIITSTSSNTSWRLWS